MTALCISAGVASITLYVNSFTLAWIHSVEKIRWEEQWIVEHDALHVVSANVRGSGAGMEPPSDAQFRNGAWHYTPQTPPMKTLRLAHSPFTQGYELCFDAHCYTLASLLPELLSLDTMVFEACER